LTTASLFRKLREHKLEMIRLKEMETVERKTKSLTLRSNVVEVDNSEESSNDYSDIKNLNLLTKRFQKFIKMKDRVKNYRSKRYSKKSDSGSTKLTCFGCGKHDHIEVDCPSIVNKEKG